MSSLDPGLRIAFATAVLAGAFGACQSPDQYYRNRGDAGLDLPGSGGTFHPYQTGSAGLAGGAATSGIAGSGTTSGAAGDGTSGAAGNGSTSGTAGNGTTSGAAGTADATGAAGGGGATGDTVPCTTCMVKVQYTCRGDDTNQASFVLDVTNESSTSFPLSSLTLRYWYTIDAGKAQELDCDFAKLGCTNIVTSADASPAPKFVAVMPPKTKATEYVEIAFKAGALALDPFLDTGELQLRVHNKDFSVFTQIDDYSYNCAMKGNPIDWAQVTAYLDGVLVWGTEPP